MNALTIEIYSDLICPWCYIGRRRLGEALKLLALSEPANILWRPFELNPDLPAEVAAEVGLCREQARRRVPSETVAYEPLGSAWPVSPQTRKNQGLPRRALTNFSAKGRR
jgi:predicted DsbA family dithiol-disulfide isomerase